MDRRWRSSSGGGGAHQDEGVVDVHELLHAVLLQHHHVGQARVAAACAVLAVDHVELPAAVLAGDEEQVEDLHLDR